jgi:hypothetical protein
MGKSDIMHGVCGAQDILQKEKYLIQGYFVKHFIFFKAHHLPKEQEVFQYRTKSPGLNHPGISAVSHWFSFFKNSYWTSHPPLLTAQPPSLLKARFKSIFGKQNTNCQIHAMTHPYPWTRTIRIGF